jgi:hypothetical protein
LLASGLRNHPHRRVDAAVAGYLRRNLESASPSAANASSGAFVAGIIALICACVVLPEHLHDVLGVRRLHEFIARAAAGFLAIAILIACWCAWRGFRKNLLRRRLFWAWLSVTLLPLAGIFASESLLVLTRLKPAWAVPIRSVLRHSVFWHLGFWEWLGSVAVFLMPWRATRVSGHVAPNYRSMTAADFVLAKIKRE